MLPSFPENNDVDLLVLDVHMSRVDGFETLCQIRNRKIIGEMNRETGERPCMLYKVD